MRDDPRTCETFDIVLTPKDHDSYHEYDLVRPATGIQPGCQDLPFNDVEYLRDVIFNKLASDHNYEVNTIRKIHVWCRNCNSYIGHIKLPFEVIPFNRMESNDVEKLTVKTRTLRCSACYYHTTISIRDLMACR
jgi:hypothetical protein